MAAVLAASGLVPDGAGDAAVLFAATVLSAGLAGAAVPAGDAVLVSAGALVDEEEDVVVEALSAGAVEAVSTGLLQAASAAAVASTNASFFMEYLSR